MVARAQAAGIGLYGSPEGPDRVGKRRGSTDGAPKQDSYVARFVIVLLWIGGLTGARTLGWPVSSEKLAPLLWSVKPQPLGTMPDPKPR